MKCSFMKKNTVIVAILLIFVLSACNGGQKIKRENLTSTDLSAVNIDGISVDNVIDDIDLTKYTTVSADRFEAKENTHYFEELKIETDANGSVKEVRGNIYGYDAAYEAVKFAVNGTDNPSSIDEVIKILGDNHNDYWFDKEQSIKAYTFYDGDNMIYGTFAFNYDSNELIWIILSK